MQAWLTLLPVALLAYPNLHGVPAPLSSGAGWAALGAIPAALLLAFRRPTLRVPGLVFLFAVLAIAVVQVADRADTFEASRAVMSLVTGVVLLLSGASLGSAGRAVLARGAAILSVIWVGGAALDTIVSAERRFAGVLENTGDLSEAALAGALIGLAIFTAERPARFLGLSAGLVYVLYVGLVPVYAGALAFLVASGAVIALSQQHAAAKLRARISLVICLVLVLMIGGRQLFEGGGDAEASATDAALEVALESTGGFDVRARIWKRVPALVMDAPLTGVGPGQFEAAFPPYRDPAEIELSTHSRAEPTHIEVEHPHNDFLLAFAEYGVPGGLAWLLFCGVVLLRSLRSLRGTDAVRAGLGAAAIALLVNAVFNGPLLAGIASAPLAFAIFGAVLAPEEVEAARGRRAILLPAVAGVLLLLQASRAIHFVKHGEALELMLAAPVVFDGGTRGQLAADLERPLGRALSECPDSVMALSKRAQLVSAQGDEEAWRLTLERILKLRPYRLEALIDSGTSYARLGKLATARSYYERALAIDPANPALERNLLQLTLDEGDGMAAIEALDAALANGAVDASWQKRAAAEFLLRGRERVGLLLFGRIDARYIVASPQEADALSREFRADGKVLMADAMEAYKNLLYGRRHIFRGRDADAVRSYFQALRITRTYPGGSPLIRLEYAAALLRAGRADDARAEVEEFVPTPVQLAELPEWAGQELLDAGLLRG